MGKLSFEEKIKRNLDNAIANIAEHRADYVHNPDADFTRNRKMSMGDTMRLIISMDGGSLAKELHVHHSLGGSQITPSGFVQQRSKIKSSAFFDLLRQFGQTEIVRHKHKGYRVLAVDSTAINQPRDPKLDSFMNTSAFPHGLNQTQASVIYDVLNKTVLDVDLRPRPRMDETGTFVSMLQRNSFPEKTIMLMDRGYESYNVFAHLIEKENAELLCRVRNRRGGMREIQKLPMEELDRDLEFEVTTTQTNEDKERQRVYIQIASKKGKINSPKTGIGRWDHVSPYTMKFRVVRFQLNSGEYETIVTTLPRFIFSVQDIKDLYHMRWGIETAFRDIKYTIGLINLHSKKEDLVMQEIYAALIAYNFCTRIVSAVIVNKKEHTIHTYQVNFKMAVYLCKRFYRSAISVGLNLIEEIGRYIEAVRPGRQDQRKLRPKGFAGFVYRVAA